MKPFYSVVILTILLVRKNESTNVSPCELGTGKLPEDVDLPGCTNQPCIFYINANSSVTMRFRSPRYLENFAPRAQAVALGLTVPYPLGQDDGCDGVTNTPCPLAKNEYIEYTYSMFIAPIFPPILFALEFSLIDKDNNNEQIECFRANIQLENLDY